MGLLSGKMPSPDKLASSISPDITISKLFKIWQLLPSLPDKALSKSYAKALGAGNLERLRNAKLAVTAFQQAQIYGNRKLLKQLRQRDIAYSLLKGAASGCLLYPERKLRASWDVDVGVAWSDLEQAEAVALECGFHQAQKDPELPKFYRADRELRAIVEESHFELGFLVRRLQPTNLPKSVRAAIRHEKWAHQFWHGVYDTHPWCYVVVDIHHKISLDIELDALLATRQSVKVDGEKVYVPSYAWLAAHLIFKLYWEGVHNYGKGLYQYADLVRLIPHLDQSSFGQLVDILTSYNLIAGAHYVFKHVTKFGITVPRHIDDFIRESQYPQSDSDPIQINDLGDVWPKLWGRR